MAQTGFTPISIYYSSTASNVPTAGNLVAGELAINTADGRLYYKDSAGVVQVIGTKGGVGSSTTTQVLYNSSGLVVGSANMTFNGTTLTLANDASISGLTVGKGGGAVSTNTAFGINAIASGSSTGAILTAVGWNAMSQNAVTGNSNSAFGARSLYQVSSGLENTAIGEESMYSTTTAGYNTSLGFASLYANTTGANNVALGHKALQANTTASNNTAVGYQAGYTNSTGQYNVYAGISAGKVATGDRNAFFGSEAGIAVTTGNRNTIIGSYDGNSSGLDIRTASNYIVLSDGAGNPRQVIDNAGNVLIGITSQSGRFTVQASTADSSTNLVYGTNSSSTKLFQIRNDGAFNTGVAAVSPYNNTTGSGANLYVASDGFLARSTSSLKYKTNVQDATHGLADVLKLRPVTYQGKAEQDAGKTFGGLIAEEVDALGLTEFVQYAEDGTPDALAYGNMVSLCVKAIQELKAEFDAYKATHP